MQAITSLVLAVHGGTRGALAELLQRHSEFGKVQVAGDLEMALAQASIDCPRLILVDTYSLPDWSLICAELLDVSSDSRLAFLHSYLPRPEPADAAPSPLHLPKYGPEPDLLTELLNLLRA